MEPMVEHDEGEWVKKSEIPGWIDAFDKHPPARTCVVALDGHRASYTCFYVKGDWFLWPPRHLEEWDEEIYITNWMPLPELSTIS